MLEAYCIIYLVHNYFRYLLADARATLTVENTFTLHLTLFNWQICWFHEPGVRTFSKFFFDLVNLNCECLLS